jgi:hypothetical protein
VLRFVSVSLGTGRPPRCGRCHGPAPQTSYLAVSEIEARIAEAVATADAPGPNVELAGPEPFGHPELPDVVTASIRGGVVRLRLHTDAAALQNPSDAAGCIAAGVRHLRFTLLGGSPGMHDALTGEPGSLDAALGGVRTYAAVAAESGAAVSISAAVPVCRHNVHDLPSAVLAAVDAGVDSVTLVLDDPGLDLRAAAPWITAACDTGVVSAVWVDVEGAPFCLLPGYDLHVSDVVAARAGSKVAACGSCALDAVCGGGPAGASADTLGALAPPPTAATLSGKVAKARGGRAS